MGAHILPRATRICLTVLPWLRKASEPTALPVHRTKMRKFDYLVTRLLAGLSFRLFHVPPTAFSREPLLPCASFIQATDQLRQDDCSLNRWSRECCWPPQPGCRQFPARTRFSTRSRWKTVYSQLKEPPPMISSSCGQTPTGES